MEETGQTRLDAARARLHEAQQERAQIVEQRTELEGSFARLEKAKREAAHDGKQFFKASEALAKARCEHERLGLLLEAADAQVEAAQVEETAASDEATAEEERTAEREAWEAINERVEEFQPLMNDVLKRLRDVRTQIAHLPKVSEKNWDPRHASDGYNAMLVRFQGLEQELEQCIKASDWHAADEAAAERKREAAARAKREEDAREARRLEYAAEQERKAKEHRAREMSRRHPSNPERMLYESEFVEAGLEVVG